MSPFNPWLAFGVRSNGSSFNSFTVALSARLWRSLRPLLLGPVAGGVNDVKDGDSFATAAQRVNRASTLSPLDRRDGRLKPGHRLLMRRQESGFHVRKAALDTFDNLGLPLDIPADGLRRQK